MLNEYQAVKEIRFQISQRLCNLYASKVWMGPCGTFWQDAMNDKLRGAMESFVTPMIKECGITEKKLNLAIKAINATTKGKGKTYKKPSTFILDVTFKVVDIIMDLRN